MKKRTKEELFSVAVIEFFLYGWIGWVYETVLTSAAWGRFAERGTLHLPILPIYGFCALLLLFTLKRVENSAAVFLLGCAVTTAAELAASYLLPLFIEERLWSYAKWPLNFEGRISLFSSIIFGLLCLLLKKTLHPLCVRLTDRMSRRALSIAAGILLTVFFADLAAVAAFGK